MFFPDHRAGLAELLRVLKPGGRVGVAVWQNPSLMEHLAIWERVAHTFGPDVPGSLRPPAWVQMDSSEGLRWEMERAGFQDVSVVPVMRSAIASLFLRITSDNCPCTDTRNIHRPATLAELRQKTRQPPPHSNQFRQSHQAILREPVCCLHTVDRLFLNLPKHQSEFRLFSKTAADRFSGDECSGNSF